MLDFIKLLGCLFLILFIVIYLVLCMAFYVEVNPSIAISAIASAIISLSVTTILKASDTKCPKCGKAFSMKEISRNTAGSRATTVDVKRYVRDRKGKILRTYAEAVPATQYFYTCVDECKFCGHRREVRRDATQRD